VSTNAQPEPQVKAYAEFWNPAGFGAVRNSIRQHVVGVSPILVTARLCCLAC